MKLDAKTVAALNLADKDDVIVFDESMPGFGHRMRRSVGGKVLRSWIVQYKRAGASRRLLLGSAEVLSAEQARQQAKKVLGKVALGQDPQADRIDRRGKDLLTLRSQADEYLAAKAHELAKRTFTERKRYLSDPRYFGPLHKLAIDTITRRDVAARTVVIMRERGNPTAARARAALSGFFTWAMRMGLTESNPIIGSVAPAEDGGRDRVLSDSELAAIWRACGDDDHGRIVRLLILGGWRRAEIGDLAWSEIDFERGLLTIPTARTKNGKAHTLPMTPTMVRIIKSVPQRATRDQLFGQRAHGFTRWHQCKAELDVRSGVRNWVAHDVRRSTATKLADLGVQPHIVEQILNHVSGHKAGPAGIYNRSSYTNEVRNALLMWDSHLHTLIEGGERKILQMSPPAT